MDSFDLVMIAAIIGGLVIFITVGMVFYQVIEIKRTASFCVNMLNNDEARSYFDNVEPGYIKCCVDVYDNHLVIDKCCEVFEYD